MNAEFFEALSMLEKERGLSADYLVEKIANAIVIAVKKDYEVEDDNVLVEIDPARGRFSVSLVRDIVEEVENHHTQVSLAEAQEVRKSYKLGDRMVTPLKTKEFGRIAAQFSEMQSKAHELITATVTRVDPARGIVALDLGKGGEAILPRNEQVPGEEYTEGQRVQVYVVDVTVTERGPRVMISRTHPGLVKRMFEMEVPEIFDGTVEIKAISREAGMRTKMAEKTDIVKWSEDVSEFISAALSPARVLKVEILDGDTRVCKVTVPDNQLSLAIGNKGQNARLCARLTGYNIDIRPESGYYGEEPDEKA